MTANNSAPINATTEGKAHHYFQTKRYVAALQMFEAARLENWDATPFAGELAEFCGPRTPDQSALDRQLQYLRRKITSTTEHKIWVAIKAHEICGTYQGSPLSEQGLLAFKAMNDRRNAEATSPAQERWRARFDDRVVRAETVGNFGQSHEGPSRVRLARTILVSSRPDEPMTRNAAPAYRAHKPSQSCGCAAT